jgi:hypothetical protein
MRRMRSGGAARGQGHVRLGRRVVLPAIHPLCARASLPFDSYDVLGHTRSPAAAKPAVGRKDLPHRADVAIC